jgi:IclR family transcriptional regulator, pca regulon regulatory protein
MDPAAVLERDVVAGLEKGLAVIEAFGEAQPRLTLTAVARQTGLTRAAARRYLLTLVRNRYAEFDGKFFSLTPRVLRLGYAYLSSTALPARIQPFLEEISEKTGESSSAAVLDGTDVVYIARSGISRIMAVDLNVGSRLPAYCTALGRVFLAFSPPEVVNEYFAGADLVAMTPRTKHSECELRVALDEVRQKGFALVDEELALGLRSIAVPIFNARGKLSTSVNISVPAARMQVAEIVKSFLPVLLAAQTELRVVV